MNRRSFLMLAGTAPLSASALLAGCRQKSPASTNSSPPAGPARVVCYCSVDSDVASPIFEVFTKSTGVRVDPVFDTEATKTTGLVNRLLGEQSRPRCDVWWSSEPLGTLRLARAGALAPYDSVHDQDFADGWPSCLRGSQRMWYGFARRFRVLVFNTAKLTTPAVSPTCLHELTLPRFQGRVGIAQPAFGTTRAHFSALLLAAGEPAYVAWLNALKNNAVRLYDGNSAVVRAISRGEIVIGLTDNDDVASGKTNGWPVEQLHIDCHLKPPTVDPQSTPPINLPATTRSQFPHAPLQLPCTLALIAGAPNPGPARQLLDALTSASTDEQLTRSPFETFPIRSSERGTDVRGRPTWPILDLDLQRLADVEARAIQLADQILSQ